MAIHTLKTWPEEFKAMKKGLKSFEFRKDDRGFQVGDTLRLREYDPKKKRYTRDTLYVAVTFILRDKPEFGLPEGFVVMQTEKIGSRKEKE